MKQTLSAVAHGTSIVIIRFLVISPCNTYVRDLRTAHRHTHEVVEKESDAQINYIGKA
jgi:hypothetical protein